MYVYVSCNMLILNIKNTLSASHKKILKDNMKALYVNAVKGNHRHKAYTQVFYKKNFLAIKIFHSFISVVLYSS